MMVTGLVLGALLVLVPVVYRSRKLSFRAQTPADLADRGPAFDPRRHLNGPILCEGVIYGPTGRVASRFVADMHGTWDGNRGRLDETFRYDTGRVQQRAWRLTLGEDGQIAALADDVPGQGTGRVAGCALNLRYRIRLDAEAGGHVLDVIDWLYLMENGTLMNRSQFRKFGVMVGELVATMRPKG
ncbi:MAG: DUF3833 domain-containing protein [Gemmobacter sp.]